jgi:hypothetical protein
MNPTLQLPKERVHALDPADVEAYLSAQGWKVDRQRSSPDVSVYHHPADLEAEILVPLDKGFIDYALRVGEVLQALAALERRTAWEVLEDLSAQRTRSSPNGTASGQQGAGNALSSGKTQRDAS